VAGDRRARGKDRVLPIGGPTSPSWREHALTRIAELRTLATWLQESSNDPGTAHLLSAIENHLTEAREAALTSRWRWAVANGSNIERTLGNIDAAEADLLRLAPLDYLSGQMPGLQARVRAHLRSGDPRRIRVEEIAEAGHGVNRNDRNSLIAAVREASSEARREETRVRSFRNVLLVTAGLLTVASAGLAVLCAARPETIPLCFRPEGKIVCPTSETTLPAMGAGRGSAVSVDAVERATVSSWDIPLIEGLGLMAAAVAGAAALRGVRGSSTHYDLPVALALLKLPTGALTAFLGLLLMRGQFVPGLNALDYPAQIMAWAIVFGYAQQLFTRLVDQQAHYVLDAAGGLGDHDVA
jgi:hypothetical protein